MASFPPSPQRLLLLTVGVVLTVISPGTGDVFTSSQKILDMVASEEILLEGLHKDIAANYDYLKSLSQFLFERSKTFHQPVKESPWQLAEHPNGAYLLIQFFSKNWGPLIKTRPGLLEVIGTAMSTHATDDDHEGALSSLIRLQHVYQFSVTDMYAGNYLGHVGPALHPSDTYLLGRRAFIDGFLPESIQWLQLSVRLLKDQGGHFPATTNILGSEITPAVTLGQAASLLGRASLYMGDLEKALEMYQISNPLDPQGGDVLALRKELDGHQVVYQHSSRPWDHNMTTLCLRPKHQPVVKILPLHVCRYKRAFGVSYLRYKEEILSIQPYASLFYDVIRDDETDSIKQHVKGKMVRGLVGDGGDGKTDRIRTSDLGWINDNELSTAASISQRVKIITGLEVDQRYPSGPSSAEAMQVVNYGLGGLYDAHVDPFKGKSENPMLTDSGFRIATFLIYLSNVEMGGSTVFVKAGISVAPRKGMALFWYNFGPDMTEIDGLTQHAGCPVVVGQKWVANKWIWTYGNTFKRPCGLHANSTQLHVEKLMTPPSL